jgi:hypothetical protein
MRGSTPDVSSAWRLGLGERPSKRSTLGSKDDGVPWCYSGTLAWRVMVDGVQVGEITLRYESTTSVCSGGGSWDWFVGGTATLE